MTGDTAKILFENASVLDAEHGTLVGDQSVLVEGARIVEVGPAGAVRASGARTIDVRGRVLMPGLIDCHVHVTAASANLKELEEWSPLYLGIRASAIMGDMLQRGFTTVRDAAGADFGLARAVEEGLIAGPRLIFGGRSLTQTGGHADTRSSGQTALEAGYSYTAGGVVCDGVPAVRLAVREEIKRGAHHIKLMLSGGVASPTDRVDSTQFSLDEIRAAVEEATAANIYVLGHAYTSRAINRGLESGVRCIEHGNLMDASSPPLFLAHEAFYVPTLVTYSALAEHGLENGLPEVSHRKIFDVLDSGLRALEMADRAVSASRTARTCSGVCIAFSRGSSRYAARSNSRRNLRAATVNAARLLRMEGQVGAIVTGAYADLLIVDANPLEDINVLADPATHFRMVMKDGQIVTDRLT